jgi:SAM-dependent methyltransferase
VTPTQWLTGHGALLPATGTALDVACGRGRHALWLASRGFDVVAVDRDAAAIAVVEQAAADAGLSVRTERINLELPQVDLGTRCYDVIVVVHYLHRPLFPALVRALRPGGVLVYETFTLAQAARGKPTNPDFLLQPGELRQLVEPLEVVVEREGDFDDRSVASIIAQARS